MKKYEITPLNNLTPFKITGRLSLENEIAVIRNERAIILFATHMTNVIIIEDT